MKLEVIKKKALEAKNKIAVAAGTTALVLSGSTVVFAADGTADPTVTTAFTTMSGNVGATMAAVAAVGVGIMGTFLAWKYGRKLFNTVAK